MNQPTAAAIHSLARPPIPVSTAGTLLLVLTAVILLASSPHAGAVKPAPGDLGNGNTGEGTGALQNDTTGANNTAFGFQSLQNNLTGDGNSGTGYVTLH